MKPKIRPKRGEVLLRLGGYWLNHIELVRYVGYWKETEKYQSIVRVLDINGRTGHTPQPGHLFTTGGVDIFTGEPTTDDVIKKFLRSKPRKKK